LLGAGGAIVLAFAAALALVFGAWVTRLTGGMTGDTWGAAIEIAEALTLLFIAALANRFWLDPWLLA
jgi:cobalamin synthase